MSKSGIHIKPSKKGTFTAAAKKHGKGVQEFARQVMANKENYSPAMVKKANFAKNAAKWKHEQGGAVDSHYQELGGVHSMRPLPGHQVPVGKAFTPTPGHYYPMYERDMQPLPQKARYGADIEPFVYHGYSDNTPMGDGIKTNWREPKKRLSARAGMLMAQTGKKILGLPEIEGAANMYVTPEMAAAATAQYTPAQNAAANPILTASQTKTNVKSLLAPKVQRLYEPAFGEGPEAEPMKNDPYYTPGEMAQQRGLAPDPRQFRDDTQNQLQQTYDTNKKARKKFDRSLNKLEKKDKSWIAPTVLAGLATVDSLIQGPANRQYYNQYDEPYYNPYPSGTGSQAIYEQGGFVNSNAVDFPYRSGIRFREGGEIMNVASLSNPIARMGGNIRRNIMSEYEQGGELELYDDRTGAQPISQNPNAGPIVEFKGPSHEERNNVGSNGIPMAWNGNEVEVEGGETAFKDDQGNFQILGNMKNPLTGRKFKQDGKLIAKAERKADKTMQKGLDLINSSDPDNPYEMLRFNSGKAKMQGATQKFQEMEELRNNLANIQQQKLDLAASLGIEPMEMDKKAYFGKMMTAQAGKKIPASTKDSVQNMANKILQYEQLRGGPGGSPLPQYKDPRFMEMLTTGVYPEVNKILPNASAMEAADAMDFVFNAGWDKSNNKILKDPRAYALQEYYRKYDPSKLDKEGKWPGRKNAAYSFDEEYNSTIGKLPENERRGFMNQGRDWYYKNTNNPAPGVPNENYGTTWYGRIANTADYSPFNPNNPNFTPQKQVGNKAPKMETSYVTPRAVKSVNPRGFLEPTMMPEDELISPSSVISRGFLTPSLRQEDQPTLQPEITPRGFLAPTMMPEEYMTQPNTNVKPVLDYINYDLKNISPQFFSGLGSEDKKFKEYSVKQKAHNRLLNWNANAWRYALKAQEGDKFRERDLVNNEKDRKEYQQFYTNLITKNPNPELEYDMRSEPEKIKKNLSLLSGIDGKIGQQSLDLPYIYASELNDNMKKYYSQAMQAEKEYQSSPNKIALSSVPPVTKEAPATGKTRGASERPLRPSMPKKVEIPTTMGSIEAAVNNLPERSFYETTTEETTNPPVQGQTYDFGVPPRVDLTSDAEGFNIMNAYPEIYAMATNRYEPVLMQKYRPELLQPYQVSFQDQLDRNTDTFRTMAQASGWNPSAMGAFAAQKYQADQGVLGNQFRTNQEISANIANANRQIMNETQQRNLGLADQQYVRQAQARANTNQRTFDALQSLSTKKLQHQKAMNELKVMENLYNFRFDNDYRAQYEGPQAVFNDPLVAGVDKDGNPIYKSQLAPTTKKTTQATKSKYGISINKEFKHYK